MNTPRDRADSPLILRAGIVAAGGLAVAIALFGLTQRLTGQSRIVAEAPAPELWRADMLDGTGRVSGASWICADAKVREAFTRALPEVNGAPCVMVGQPVMQGPLFAGRCLALGQRFSVNATRSGDLDSDFRLRVRIRPLQGPHPGASGVIRYRKAGPCPATWRTGDSAKAADAA